MPVQPEVAFEVLAQVIEELAEARLGFNIEFVNMGGGAVYDRVLAERKGGVGAPAPPAPPRPSIVR